MFHICLFPGTSEAKKFSDLGADIAKCNVTPKVEVGFMMNCYKLFSFFVWIHKLKNFDFCVCVCVCCCTWTVLYMTIKSTNNY